MAKLSQTYIIGTITDPLLGVDTINSLVTNNANAPVSITRLILANGDNTITVPSTSRGVIITFNSLCNTAKTLKGAAGDTGVVIASTILGGVNAGTFLISFGTPVPATLIINSTGADADFAEFCFI